MRDTGLSWDAKAGYFLVLSAESASIKVVEGPTFELTRFALNGAAAGLSSGRKMHCKSVVPALTMARFGVALAGAELVHV
jgi:hypothetical protein